MEQYRIECGGLTLTVQQETAGWKFALQGWGEKYEFLALDGDSAKNACIQGAKAVLTRLGSPIPACLTDAKWTAY